MKRAIFVRSKTTVMTELDKKIREKEIYKVTLVGSFVNFLLVIFKFLAGIAGHSAAMLADAVHSLSDFVTDVVVILFVRISNKPVDKSHDYGHGKYETLATAFIGMALLGIGFGILWNGATEILVFLRGGELRQPGMLALVAAIISILLKEILYQYTVRVGEKMRFTGCCGECMVRPAVRMRGSASTSTLTVRLDKSASNIVFSSKLKMHKPAKPLPTKAVYTLK